MPEFKRAGAEVNARIAYWGPRGSGKTTNVEQIYSRLRPDHRGELRRIPTRLDPSACYEVLPIELGELGGVRTRLQIVAVPGAPDQAPTRKQLLDRVDGVVFVIDAQRDRIEENLACFAELRRSLASYGRTLTDVPLVLQYNKRDLADPYALEELHRKLDMRGAAAFEAVAREGVAVLPTLTTISKRVVRFLREQAARPRPEASQAQLAPAPPPGVSQVLDLAASALPAEQAAPAGQPLPEAPRLPETPRPRERAPSRSSILSASYHPETDADDAAATTARARALLDADFDEARDAIEKEDGTLEVGELSVTSVGRAEVAGPRAVRVPLVLQDGQGRSLAVTLTVQIDPVDGLRSPAARCAPSGLAGGGEPA